MPIGAIAGVATVGAGLINSSSQNHAADKAADTSLATARENNALARDIYGQNKTTLQPYINSGYAATNALDAFLGLNPAQAPAPAQGTPTPQPTTQMPAWGMWNGGNSLGLPDRFAWQNDAMPGSIGANAGMTPQMGAQTTPYNPQNAFRNYIANSDYGFQFGQGSNQVNSGYAGAGTLQSGAAMKALEDYRQNLQSGYRNEYLGYLGQQQSAGLSGASALAGVGQNYVANVSANNNSAGTAAANAALAKGANNPWANALGTIGGMAMGYGRGF